MLRRRREGCEGREQRGKVAVPGAVVLAHPRGVEPDGLGEPHELDRVGVLAGEVVPRGELAREEPEPDPHRHAPEPTVATA